MSSLCYSAARHGSTCCWLALGCASCNGARTWIQSCPALIPTSPIKACCRCRCSSGGGGGGYCDWLWLIHPLHCLLLCSCLVHSSDTAAR
jgi:hypothetical protein